MTGPAFLRKPSRINDAPPTERDIRCQNLAQFTGGEAWRLSDLHDRKDDLLIWITRGQGRVTVNGVRRGIGAHNAMVLPSGTLMSLELGPQSLAQVVQCPTGLLDPNNKGAKHLRIRDSLGQAELTGEIEAMQREISLARPFLYKALEAHMRLISVWIARQEANGALDAPKETAAQRLVKRYAAKVVQNYTTDMVMADYAEALDVTPTHLTRVCRSTCGKTAADMLVERKLYEARRMLAQPKIEVKEIAKSLGFGSAAYFTRFIQSHLRMSPTAYRKAALKKPANVTALS